MSKIDFIRIARSGLFCSVVAMSAVLAAGVAEAQDRPKEVAAAKDSADQDTASLQDIVVTARKVSEKLQDVPVTVTAFSGEDLVKQNATRLGDVGHLTPSISFRQSSTNPSGLLIALRGQFQRDTRAALDPSVGIYVDGVYWARAYGTNADLVDLKSAQILKGPQGTLFGRNTTGGAVVLETNDPDYNDVSGMASLLYGRYNERSATGVLNIPLLADKIALRGAIQVNKRDGYIHDVVTGRAYEGRDTWTGRVKLGIKPTDTFSIILSGERYSFKQAGQARYPSLIIAGSPADIYATEMGPINGMTLAQFVAYAATHPNETGTNATVQAPAPDDFVPDAKYKTKTYSGTATLDTGIGTFKLIGAYRNVLGHSALDLEGSPWAIHTSYLYQDLTQYSGELQLTGKAFNNVLSYAAGAFWFKEDGTDSSYSYTFAGGAASSNATVRAGATSGTNFRANVDNKSTGAYAQFTVAATDRLNLTGGLRYSADTRGATLRSSNLTGTGDFKSCSLAAFGAVRDGTSLDCTPVSRSDDFHNVSYLASADYRLAPDVLAYVRFSKGYRSGGQNLTALTPLQFVPFGPEIVHELEGGIKSEFLDRRVRLNISAYRSIITGAQRGTIIVDLTTGKNVSIFGNAAKVRVLGLEAELKAALGGGFQLAASGALTRPKYLSYSDATGDRRGERFNAVPREQFTVMGSYDHDLGFGKLDLRMDYSWASATPLDEYNTPSNPNNAAIIAATTRPAGGMANARASLTFGDDSQYEVALFGRNIFNNRDINSALQVAGFGYVGATRNEPATYGIQATVRFGN